jgi:ABC-type uncharacterized transport system ATPase subunit
MSYGEKEVLKGVNLEVHKGEIIGYIGANGAGKSTTIKILLGIVEGYRGEVRVLGRYISKDNLEYKGKIGYVPEIDEIYDNLTAREYLTFIGALYGLEDDRTDKKAGQLMELFDIKDSYDTRINSYSKGMVFFLMLLFFLVLTNLFVIVLTSLVYFVILRFFDGEKLKDIINYIQIILTIVLMLGYQLVGRLLDIAGLQIKFVPHW